MLGVPGSPGAAGWALLALGAVLALAACVALRRRARSAPPTVAAAVLCLVVTVAALPYVAWRFAEDLRVTTRLHGYDAASAGPVQAYLPGYLVDGARRLIPPGATFSAVAGDGVPWSEARKAFPSLALETLFPRRSGADPRRAEYVIAWGVAPARLADVSRVWVARPRSGAYPAVLVGKVAG